MTDLSRIWTMAGVTILTFTILLAPRSGLAFFAVVNCPEDSIQSALDSGATMIEVTGECIENVEIRNDGTSIQGSVPPNGTDKIVGNLLISGVQRIVIRGLTVEERAIVGADGRTSIGDGAAAFLEQMTLNGPTEVVTGAYANFVETNFIGPGSIGVVNAGNALIASSTIQNKQGDFFVSNNSFLQLSDSTVSNLGGAVFIVTGSSASVFNTTIEATDNGIQILRGSTVRFGNSVLKPAIVDDASVSCNPVCIGDNSEVRFDNTSIEGTNDDPGIGGAISVFRQSSVRIRGGSSVTNNGTQPAIALFHNSSGRQDKGSAPPTVITGGISALGSYVDFRNFISVGDIIGDLKSVVRLRGTDSQSTSVVNGNVILNRDSSLDLGSPAPTVNGDIVCLDKESAASGVAGGSGERKCKVF